MADGRMGDKRKWRIIWRYVQYVIAKFRYCPEPALKYTCTSPVVRTRSPVTESWLLPYIAIPFCWRDGRILTGNVPIVTQAEVWYVHWFAAKTEVIDTCFPRRSAYPNRVLKLFCNSADSVSDNSDKDAFSVGISGAIGNNFLISVTLSPSWCISQTGQSSTKSPSCRFPSV